MIHCAVAAGVVGARRHADHGVPEEAARRSLASVRRPCLPQMLTLTAALCLMQGLHASDDDAAGESPVSVPGARTVGVDEAYRLYLRGVAFVDVRSPRLHRRRHMPRTHHLDLNDGFTRQALQAIVATDDPFVIHCSGTRCRRSATASAFAVEWGFTRVMYFREGIRGWRSAGLPLIEAP